MGIGKVNTGFPNADPKNCCKSPQLLRRVSAAITGDRQRASPAMRLHKEATSAGAGPPFREIPHVESDPV
jgi:hypothetical protein